MNKKEITKNIILSVIISLALSVYNAAVQAEGDTALLQSDGYGIGGSTAVVFLVLFAILTGMSVVGYDKVFRYRFLIAAVLFVICVIFGITGSSIGYLTSLFGREDTDILLGVSRGIRGDEWATFTPMTWAQYLNPTGKFTYFNSVVRAAETDVFLEYGQPVASWLMIFKPFFFGYLFLPVDQGMAFFWAGRLIALFLVSFEFARLFTKDNRRLSVVYAFVITMSPAVQWWFAINGFVEMLITLQLSIVLLDKFIVSEKKAVRMACIAGITVCAGCYALTMYPAWMIPLAYVLLGLIIWVIYEKRDKFRLHAPDIICLAVCAVFLGFSLLYVFKRSSGTITAIMNTVYPGKRFETGGGILDYLFNYVSNIWYPIMGEAPYLNVCEAAYFISLFPMGFIMYFIYLIKNKKSDALCNIMMVVLGFFTIWCVFGIPSFASKLSFMSSSTANRTLIAYGFANIIILFRCIALFVERGIRLHKVKSAAVSAFTAGLAIWVSYRLNREYYNYAMLAVEFVIFTLLCFGCIAYTHKAVAKVWGFIFIMVMMMSGFLVNPVRSGEKSVKNVPELVMVENVVKQDPEAVWIVEGAGYPVTNFLLLKGARTVNSTNVYPMLDRWKSIDEEGKYEDIYNRYAHILINYGDGEGEEKFSLMNPDYFMVYLNYSELKKLNVEYIFTCKDLSGDEKLTQIDSEGVYSVYKLN